MVVGNCDVPCTQDEKARREATAALLRRSQKREEAANALCKEIWICMRDQEAKTRATTEKIEPALAARCRELNVVKAQLKKRLQELDVKVEKTRLELYRTNWELSNHDDPLGKTGDMWTWRKDQHPASEQIDDDPKTALQAQHETLRLNQSDLQARVREDNDALNTLLAHREALQADLDEKQQAFNIDSRCLHRGSTQGDRSKAPISPKKPTHLPQLTAR